MASIVEMISDRILGDSARSGMYKRFGLGRWPFHYDTASKRHSDSGSEVLSFVHSIPLQRELESIETLLGNGRLGSKPFEYPGISVPLFIREFITCEMKIVNAISSTLTC
jgi:squalene cyclase